MSERSEPGADEWATLVAYLDGELPQEQVRALEARMSQDAAVRAEVESLKRTWELLDYLPTAEPSTNFTHRTVNLVTAEYQEARRARLRRRRWLIGAGWAAAILVAALGGFAGVTSLTPREPSDEDLMRELRLIENQQLYEQADNIGFLKALDQPDLFGDDDPDMGT